MATTTTTKKAELKTSTAKPATEKEAPAKKTTTVKAAVKGTVKKATTRKTTVRKTASKTMNAVYLKYRIHCVLTKLQFPFSVKGSKAAHSLRYIK